MQTLFAHPAAWRGFALFAGTLAAKVATDAGTDISSLKSDDLVSWCSGAKSRREDELARQRQSELE
ncbi:MAG: hypothetical protein WC617_11325 [Rhodanobacter sp.]|jgi:hypothetical protein